MATYSYITLADARAQLALRLCDTTNTFWPTAELNLAIAEALRTFSAITQYWVMDFTFIPAENDLEWRSIAAPSATVSYSPSPRTRTLTTDDLFTSIQYALLEAPVGSAPSAGIQFSSADYLQSFSRRRDAFIQAAQTNVLPIPGPISLPVSANRLNLPDSPTQTILDVLRVQYYPLSADYGLPTTLFRDDTLGMEYFDPAFPTNDGIPLTWAVNASPALTITFDARAPFPNTLGILASYSGAVTPGSPAPLLIPDDFAWVLKYGIMADLLTKESEATDLARAAYCESRWQEGLKLLTLAPWLIQARVNNVPIDTPSLSEADSFSLDWETNTPSTFPLLVRGGIDLLTTAPIPDSPNEYSVTLSLAGNAPIPTADGDFLQLPREYFDVLLDYAQHICKFKQGGSEFSSSISLYQTFLQSSIMMNKRMELETIFATTLRGRPREEVLNPRAEDV